VALEELAGIGVSRGIDVCGVVGVCPDDARPLLVELVQAASVSTETTAIRGHVIERPTRSAMTRPYPVIQAARTHDRLVIHAACTHDGLVTLAACTHDRLVTLAGRA